MLDVDRIGRNMQCDVMRCDMEKLLKEVKF
jgi:hypothetical protein